MSDQRQHVQTYYDQIAEAYDGIGYAPEGPHYPANHYRLELAQSILADLKKGPILDAGCGTGLFLRHAIAAGWDATGCDFSAGMLTQARENLSGVDEARVKLVQTSLDDLGMFDDETFEHVFCLGVLPYVADEDEGPCYAEMRRVLRPGGALVTAHENELFDLFTFNKYTLRFFARNVAPLIEELQPESDCADLKGRLATLMTYPEKPVNTNPTRSGRDIVFTKPENPLTYADKLHRNGFTARDTLYYHFHAVPPLLREGDAAMLEASKKMELRLARSWQGMFLASTFISVATVDK